MDLFLRAIHEPALLKVFLKFILCARIDEMSLLDTLIQRINFNTKVMNEKNDLFNSMCFVLVGIGIVRIVLYIDKS